MIHQRACPLPLLLLAGSLLLGACNLRPSAAAPSTPTPASAAVASEQPAATEQNPAGDIPDTQVFVPYRSAGGGYEIAAPEGWARTEDTRNVRFVDKLDGLSVVLTPATAAPSAASARDHEAKELAQAGRAVQIGEISEVTLPGGAAVRIVATSNSEPDPVTNKQVRLEQQSYLFFHNGVRATVTVWAPLGADNVDQWQHIAESFHWT